ncbi:delta(14)-sterol reductase LBR-like [Mustelus asterias]
MPAKMFSDGEMVMGRWPGSQLYYEVQVTGYNKSTQLYAVKYKDGTELNLKESDVKPLNYFKTKKRSSPRQRSRSRSRSPARTQTPKRSTSRGRETKKTVQKEEVQKKDLPAAKFVPQENSTNSKSVSVTDLKEEEENNTTKKIYRVVEHKIRREIVTDQLDLPYNLRTKKEEGKVVELETKDDHLYIKKQVVRTHEWEFGGRIGVLFIMFFLPIALILLLLMCAQEDASVMNFPPPIPALETLWSSTSLGIFVLWFLFQALLYLLPIGKIVDGVPLANGKKLKYRINAFYAFLLCGVAVAAALYNEVKLIYIHNNLLQLAISSMVFSFVLGIYLYVRSWRVPADELAVGGNSGTCRHCMSSILWLLIWQDVHFTLSPLLFLHHQLVSPLLYDVVQDAAQNDDA